MAFSDYKATIGLEIHAELDTETKMFCRSKNDGDETRPNVNICPVCMGYPGTLPVINKKAVEYVLRVGVAVGGTVADFTEFDRKNYFYPDIPKGYQISQYKYPLVSGGVLKNVEIVRIHLEEDTARSTHEGREHSLIDFNRAGVPLLEMVSKPAITSAEQAGDFAREFQLLLRVLGVSRANMEKGEMRVEANVSVSKTDGLGTKTEVKNLNSFRSVERAIEYEINRHKEVLEGGGKVVQETRGWEETAGVTFAQRTKEAAHDYRYFPEPDLPKLYLSRIPEFSHDKMKEDLPELPWEKRQRMEKDFGLRKEAVEIFVSEPVLGNFFEKVAQIIKEKEAIKQASNYTTSDLIGLMKGQADAILPSAHNFSKLMEMMRAGDLSSRGTKDILAIMVQKDEDPEIIARRSGWLQKNNDEEIQKIADTVIKENKNVAEEYKSGKETALQFLVGQGMKLSKGSVNPEKLGQFLKKNLQEKKTDT